MENTELIRLLNKDLPLELPGHLNQEEIKARLADWINELIKHDFEKLVSLLYRIDVHEQKLRTLLKQFPDEDAGHIIASLILERQEQKQKSRQLFSQRDDTASEEEKWRSNQCSCNCFVGSLRANISSFTFSLSSFSFFRSNMVPNT